MTAAFGRRFVSYREARAWAAGVVEVVEVVEWIADINDAGHARTAALLAQHAHKRAESAVNRVVPAGVEPATAPSGSPVPVAAIRRVPTTGVIG